MGLWTERLVGGEASRPDDSPALVAVCGLSTRAGYRLCRMAGLGKMILAGVKPAKAADRAHHASRAGVAARPAWRERSGVSHGCAGRRAIDRSIEAAAAAVMPRGSGCFTLARLLADFEPFRLRWALEHWPYPIVKLTRSLMSEPVETERRPCSQARRSS